MTQRSDTTTSFERWLELLRSSCALYRVHRDDERPFVGWVQPLRLGGLKGTDVGCNASAAVERTLHEIERDGAEHFLVGSQLLGAADVLQNGGIVRVEPGDIVLFDTSRPMQYRCVSGTCNFLTLRLQRASCMAHLGFEPAVGVRRSDCLAARLLLQVFQSARRAPGFQDCEPGVDIIVYDLVRALFELTNRVPVSPHSDRLFQRVCRSVERHFADPNVGPAEIAAEVGISLRYLQKLFTRRGTTCGQHIRSVRLSRAFRLLAGRTEAKGGPSICETAWASGYRDLSHFHRVFRHRFGCSPGACRGQNKAPRHERSSRREDSAAAYRAIKASAMTEN
jgi:AraC family transcriptional regulator, positive regulator of tynA and feaB